MANEHTPFDQTKVAGSRLRNGMNATESGRDILVKELATMTADLTGDGSSDTHFTNVVTNYGFRSTAEAHSAWSTLQIAVNDIGSATQTYGAAGSVKAALDQLFNFLR